MHYRFLTRPAGSAATPSPITSAMIVAVNVGTRPMPWNFGSGLAPQDITGPGALLSNALARIHINNWFEAVEFNLDQFTAPGATPCSGITNVVDVRYTIDHELIADWSISLVTSAMIPGGTPAVAGNTVPALRPEPHGGRSNPDRGQDKGESCSPAREEVNGRIASERGSTP